MTQDAEDVQKDDVSKETPLPPPDVSPGGGAPDQPLSEARVRELMAELVEPYKREAQSAKDIARDAQDRARLAEDTLASMETGLRDIDPDATESAKLKATVKHYQARDAQAYQRQQIDVFAKNFRANMNQFITEMGVDPSDKAIDWADDAKDYLLKQQRILASVAKIGKETKEVFEKRVKQEAEDKVAHDRKEAGIDSVDSSASLGAGGKLTKEKIEKMTPEEVALNYEEINKFFGTK